MATQNGIKQAPDKGSTKRPDDVSVQKAPNCSFIEKNTSYLTRSHEFRAPHYRKHSFYIYKSSLGIRIVDPKTFLFYSGVLIIYRLFLTLPFTLILKSIPLSFMRLSSTFFI